MNKPDLLKLKEDLTNCGFTSYTHDDVFLRPDYNDRVFNSFVEYQNYYDSFYYLVFKFGKVINDTAGLIVILTPEHPLILRKIYIFDSVSNFEFDSVSNFGKGLLFDNIFKDKSYIDYIDYEDFFELALKENVKLANYMLFNKDIFDSRFGA